MLLNRVELGENRVIYYRLRNIGPATAGSAGPVPAPLILEWSCIKMEFGSAVLPTDYILLSVSRIQLRGII